MVSVPEEVSVNCADFGTFLAKITQLRQADDLIPVALNNQLPTKSFRGCKESKTICDDFKKQIGALEATRMSLINRCVQENESRMNATDDPLEKKMIRYTLRKIRTEGEVDEIVSARAMKAVSERCDRLL